MSNLYYAYGIKNSFGFDFDPVTGKMWETENGPTFGDEINLVDPGFNSGWAKVQGVWFVQSQEGAKTEPGKGERVPENPQGLVGFGGKGKYSSPEFTWINRWLQLLSSFSLQVNSELNTQMTCLWEMQILEIYITLA